MELGLEGARAVISGGSQGIGLAVAEHLVKEGASVCIAARRKDILDASVETLSKHGSAYGFVCDVSDYDATVQWMKDAAQEMGGIDIVVHNATGSGQPDGGPDSWRKNFEIDVLGMVGMSEGALPFLEQSDRAVMVQIASITGVEHHDVPISPSYGAMKAASIRHMAQRAQQWGPK
jgi:3-oxoacyl-[acyl-carrier protein] reductase